MEHLAQVGVLSSGLAHEVRNYLNAMQAQIALLRKSVGPEAEAVHRRIEKLERNVVGLEQFLADFLAFARPADNHLEDANTASLVREVLDFMAWDFERTRVEVIQDNTSPSPLICVDKAKLKRAILNLIVNARQAMPCGGRLFVRVRSTRGHAVIEVEDTGCGIPPDVQPRVFETFYSTKLEGTGLGLAVVKRTVEDLGGSISFESQLGHGTTFRITLPTAGRNQPSQSRQPQFGRASRLPSQLLRIPP